VRYIASPNPTVGCLTNVYTTSEGIPTFITCVSLGAWIKQTFRNPTTEDLEIVGVSSTCPSARCLLQRMNLVGKLSGTIHNWRPWPVCDHSKLVHAPCLMHGLQNAPVLLPPEVCESSYSEYIVDFEIDLDLDLDEQCGAVHHTNWVGF
jgi:hypothetical protein